jgi:ATPase involved in DNA replication initiation
MSNHIRRLSDAERAAVLAEAGGLCNDLRDEIIDRLVKGLNGRQGHINRASILGSARDADLVAVRHQAIYLHANFTFNLTWTGRAFNRHRKSVEHALKVFGARLDYDDELAEASFKLYEEIDATPAVHALRILVPALAQLAAPVGRRAPDRH